MLAFSLEFPGQLNLVFKLDLLIIGELCHCDLLRGW
jgi:hypothetical protein